MIEVSSYCVDSTEVTNGQYSAFLASVEPTPTSALSDAGIALAVCAFNTSYYPSGWTSDVDYPSGDQHFPVGGVDWCDAHDFCVWAGKRLCGEIGGGPVDFNQLRASVEDDEWYYACSAAGAQTFPYGNTFEPTYCNGLELHSGSYTDEVTADTKCIGGSPGIYDMSGNVWEWEDSCQSTNGANDYCSVRGGSFNWGDSPGPDGGVVVGGYLACNYTGDAAAQFRSQTSYADVGFRCCADLP
jgi:formylglycine-generating enzyme required for sulfatase activity